MKAILKKEIDEAVHSLGLPPCEMLIEHPGDISHGDYSTNVAMVLAKGAGVSPKDLAEKIAGALREKYIPFVSLVEVAGPGFINITLDPSFFVQQTETILEKGNSYGTVAIHKGKKILVEHSSPNLFKPFHVGHVMNNAIGESISRLAKASGAEVVTMSFPSDISLGVAKAIFMILEKSPDGNLEKPSIEVLGNAYAEGTKRYEEDESIHIRVKEIADNLYAKKDSPEWRAFVVCKDFNIAYFEYVTARFGSSFDAYIYESEAGIVGKELVQKNTPEVFTKSDGAIVYIPNEADTHLNTAVFINSQGNPTYEAKDLGLLQMKFERFSPDISVFMTDNQQISHFQIVFDSAKKINLEWVEKSEHRYHGRMTFKGKKMSSRLGGVPLATELLEGIHAEIEERGSDTTDKEKEKIAISSLKFAILKSEAGKNIDFDPEVNLSFEGDSGPYIQYTIARINSLLVKAGDEGIEESLEKNGGDVTLVEKLLYRFPEVVELSAKEWAPHHVAIFGLSLARAFNSFYGNTKLIDKENPDTGYNLALARAVATVLTNTLYLLGIESSERM